jgi:hypothetical protein
MPSSDNAANDTVWELQRRTREMLRAQQEAYLAAVMEELSKAMAGPDKKRS